MTEARVRSFCKEEGIEIGYSNANKSCLDHVRNDEVIFICINLFSI